jgi:hypothetical protein
VWWTTGWRRFYVCDDEEFDDRCTIERKIIVMKKTPQ